MQPLSETCFLLHSSSISGRKATLCRFLNHTYSDSPIFWAYSFPFLGCPCKRSHLRIHAVIRTCIKRCQVSYFVASSGMIPWTRGRQTKQWVSSISFLASIRHSGAVSSTSQTGQWRLDCSNQSRPFHLVFFELRCRNSSCNKVCRIVASWAESPLAWCNSLVNLLNSICYKDLGTRPCYKDPGTRPSYSCQCNLTIRPSINCAHWDSERLFYVIEQFSSYVGRKKL